MNLQKRKNCDKADINFVESVIEWEKSNGICMDEFNSRHSRLAVKFLEIIHDFVLYDGEGKELIEKAEINLNIDSFFLSCACGTTASYFLKSEVIKHLGITNELAEKHKDEIDHFYG